MPIIRITRITRIIRIIQIKLYILYIKHYTFYILHYKLYAIHSLYNIHYSFYAIHYTFSIIQPVSSILEIGSNPSPFHPSISARPYILQEILGHCISLSKPVIELFRGFRTTTTHYIENSGAT